MSNLRPLPTVIGPTENALRALLRRLLADTPIHSYERWVAMNTIAGRSTSVTELTGSLTDALVVGAEVVDELLAGLESDQLTDAVGDRIAISTVGDETLRRARRLVGDVTARLVGDLNPEDLAATRRVLDEIRTAAKREMVTREP